MKSCPVIVSAAVCVAASLGQAQDRPPPADEARVTRAVTLEEVVSEVAEKNEVWKITQARIERAQAARRQALAELLPSVSLSARGTRYGQDIDVAGSQVRPQYDWGVSGQASIAVFDGASYPLYSRTGELLGATKAMAKWQRDTLSYEARRAFYLLAAAQERVAITERTVKVRQAQLEQAEALLGAQIAVRLDVERARAQLLEAKQALLQARATRGNADDALGTLLASDLRTELRAESGGPALAKPPTSAPLDNLEMREDFQATQRQISAVQLDKKSVWWSFLPMINLNVDAQTGPETAFSNPDGFTWSATVEASWLLYDGGGRLARIDQLDAQVREQTLQYQRELRQAISGVREALRAWQTATAAVDVARHQIKAARQAHQTAKQRFEHGLGTNIDVIQASETLFQAETTLNQRIFDARTAAAQYRYLIGLMGGQ